MNKLEKQFYKEVKSDVYDFVNYVIERIKKEKSIEHSAVREEYEKIRNLNLSDEDLKSLQKIIEDAIIGAIHSLFVSIDGGTALSDEGKALDLIDRKTGKPLTEGALHENFMEIFD